MDVLFKERFKDTETCFLLHTENQASARSEFLRRMFGYFSRPHEKYALPVYPVALFSCQIPMAKA